MPSLRLLTVAILMTFVGLNGGTVSDLPIPSALLECFRKATSSQGTSKVVGEMVTNICIKEYLWATGKSRWNPTVDHKIYGFISNIFQKYANNPPKTLRVRKEYRRLTEVERKNYHSAVNALKHDTSLYPNTYDAIADFHNAEVVRTAHGGPNFFGWHRIYLFVFEEALRLHYPNVTLPYWDCTLDADLYNPSKSVIWSKWFAGNGRNFVRKGPFKYWRHAKSGQLTRNVGVGPYELINRTEIHMILSKNHTEDISLPLKKNFEYALEVMHGRLHQFVNGQMALLTTSAHDPIFFVIHTFIDYVWFLFRSRQAMLGIDPSRDYPDADPKNVHFYNRPMDGFKNISYLGISKFPNATFLNIDGYDNKWTQDYYTYELSPTCSKEKPTCNSHWLYCDTYNENCMSKTLWARPPRRHRKKRRYIQRWRHGRGKRQTNDDEEEEEEEDEVVEEEETTCETKTTFQNTFLVDGEAESSKWVYMPVKVIYQRRAFERFNSYSVHKGNANLAYDMYNPEVDRKYTNNTQWWGRQKATDKCLASESGEIRVFVETNGLNYLGTSMEYSTIDERMAFSSSYVYVPVKEPKHSNTQLLITSYDSCGRLCKPHCKSENQPGSEYKPCSGVISISPSSDFYGQSYTDAVLKVWQTKGRFNMPSSSDKSVHVVFYCDLDEKWPWGD